MSASPPVIDPDPLAHWRTWLGRSEQRGDLVTAAPLNAWVAMLDRDDAEALPGSDLPPLAHWLFFLPVARQSQIGPDGHPQRGGFLPPIPLPRRMWAGGRLTFHHALHVGDGITRTSADCAALNGRVRSMPRTSAPQGCRCTVISRAITVSCRMGGRAA